MRRLTLATVTALSFCTLPGLLELPPSLGLSPGVALAQAQGGDEDPEITNMAKQHFKLGQDAYAAGKYDVAIKELKRAYVLKRIPAILVNIAMTYRKTKDYEMAIYFYKKFLAEAPADDKTRPSAESAIAEVEAERTAASQPAQLEPAKPAVEMAKPVEAAKPVPAAKPATPGAPATPAPSGEQAAAPEPAAAPDKPASEWAHTPIDAVPPGQPIDVRVQMPVMKGVKVKVFYRKEGQASFDSMELKRRGNEKVARLPAEVTQGKTLQYYVEARDAAGTVVKNSGNEFSPNIVLIDPTARPVLAGAEATQEGPDDDQPAQRAKAGPKRDIENEAASFDLGSSNNAMAKLREQLKSEEKKKNTKSVLGPVGWGGVASLAVGVAGLGAGGAFLGLAYRNAQIVSADSRCENTKMKCFYYGPNDDPALNKAPTPSSYDYEQQGKLFDKVGIAVTAVGGALVAAGGAMLVYDIVKRQRDARPPAPPKKKKIKKVIEVEETAQLYPVVAPGTVGLVSGFRF